MEPVSERSGLNAAYVDSLLEQYRDNPDSVDPAWRAIFARRRERAGDRRVSPPPAVSVARAPVSSPGEEMETGRARSCGHGDPLTPGGDRAAPGPVSELVESPAAEGGVSGR